MFQEAVSGLQSAISSLYSSSNQIPPNIAAWADVAKDCGDLNSAYKFFVGNLNSNAISYSKSHTLAELGKYLQTHHLDKFEKINGIASNLKDTCNIQDPDTIAKLDPIINKALAIYGLKPQDIPFFGSPEADLILTGLIIGGSILAYKLVGQKYFGDIFHKPTRNLREEAAKEVRKLHDSKNKDDSSFSSPVFR